MSFKKRRSTSQPNPCLTDTSLPHGVYLSPITGHPVTSWGLRSIDAALGGGLPIGTLTVVTEDHPSSYFRPLCSYLIAQGIHSSHAVALATFHLPPHTLLKNLPAPVQSSRTQSPLNSPHQRLADMKIAWRYQKNADPSTHIVSGDASPSTVTDFDLSQNYSIPASAPISSLHRNAFSSSLADLLRKIDMHMQKATQERRFARIIVQGLSHAYIDPSDGMTVFDFLAKLRALARVYGCIAIVTCVGDIPWRTQCVTADTWLQVETFNGRGAGVAGLGKEWLGVFVVKKTYREGRGQSFKGKGDVWVFKRGRRKYTMERATAAPDEVDDDVDIHAHPSGPAKGRASVESSAAGSAVCGSKPGSSPLDF